MADLVLLVPTRGRPAAARQLAQAFASTCHEETGLVFVVDEDDPLLPDYSDIPRSWFGSTRPAVSLCIGEPNSNMVRALNGAAVAELRLDKPPFALGFCGDDHRPRTEGWDKIYLDKLRELGTGMVYGDDLFQGARIPTQIAMTSDIVRALGWMAPPDLVHLCVDDWWLQLGQRAGCIRYLPDVVVEHMHPVARNADGSPKSEWTEGHLRVNAAAMYERDRATLAKLQATDLPVAVEKVKALRG